mgnify:CR=1 FL=1
MLFRSGRDNRRYGPLPNAWGKFQGQFVCGSQTILVYSVGDAQILETPKLIAGANRSNKFARILNILPHTKRLELRVADLLAQEIASEHKLASPQIKLGKRQFGHLGDTGNCQWTIRDKMLTLSIPPSDAVQQIAVWCDPEGEGTSVEEVQNALPKAELELLGKTRNHPPRWSQILETKTQQTFAKNGFAVDTLVSPESNPWLAQLRFTGLDFFSDGSMAVCSWDGDVWHVRENPEQNSWTWKRMVSGLYQPLGLKILQDTVYLTCRDQLAALHDLDGDDEADFIECFNNDHQVTEHFHEFAMGLQTDDEGNFYYAKSGRHALKAVVPQHGTLLKVSADGSKTDILATGFRAANGVCLNRDGSFIVTDQEGFWNPKNRINWVTVDGPPKFYGNMFGYHDVTDSSDDAMVPPLCWITNAFDRSPAELLWVDSPTWGELQGGLLNLSYGYGKVYLVLHEQIAGKHQGGMIELPIPAFPTGVMRGRFSLGDHHLYLCGMFSWAGNATKPGGLYRIRKLPQPSHLPIAMKAYEGAIELEFAHPIDLASLDPSKVSLQQWGLKRSERYGSDHIDPHAVPVDRLSISNEGRTLRIESAALKPSWGMEIRYELRGVDEAPVSGVIHNTIHQFNSNQTK